MLNNIIHIIILVTLSLIFINLVNNLLHFRKLNIKKGKLLKTGEKISILIPCRNEENNIGRCLDSLLTQTYNNFTITVLDDMSEDNTYSIVKEYEKKYPDKIKLLRGKPLPEGWTGKNWACHQLFKQAEGEWLLFIDADTRHGKNSISYAYSIAKRFKSDLVSYIPYLENISLAEKIVLPVIHFAFYLFFPFYLINKLEDKRLGLALGPFILIKRHKYIESGGHFIKPHEIVDDVSLARRVKEKGGKIYMIEGKKHFRVRFYSNLSEIWHGFSKNSIGAFGYSSVFMLIFLLLAYIIFLHPLVGFLFKPEFSLKNPYFVEYGFIMFLRLIIYIKTGQGLLSIIFHPFMMIFSLLFALNSILKKITQRNVVWKERKYVLK